MSGRRSLPLPSLREGFRRLRSRSPARPEPAPDPQPEPVTNQHPALTATPSAFEKACMGLDENDRKAFEAFHLQSPESLIGTIKTSSEQHKDYVRIQASAERMSNFLAILHRFIHGVSIGIQADPAISSLVVGGFKLVLDIGINFLDYFLKLADMIERFGEWVEPLARYAQTPLNKDGDALAGVYRDLLRFCSKARSTFQSPDGKPRKVVSVQIFFRSVWKPFQVEFGSIESSFRHHVDVLLNTAQAMQIQNQVVSVQNEKRGSFLNWISTVDHEAIQNTTYQRIHKGTAEWIFEKREFKAWKDGSDSSILWCYGPPGRGKSTIASNVVHRLTSAPPQRKTQHQRAVCYAYCQNDREETFRVPEVLATFVKQLCQQLKYLPRSTLDAFGERLSNCQNPPQSEIETGLRDLLGEFCEVYIVIDGMDESHPEPREALLELLLDLVSTTSNVNMFLTSRRDHRIRFLMEKSSIPMFEFTSPDIASDIDLFVTDTIESGKLRIQTPELKRDVISTLTKNSGGMFLWVKLQLQSLKRHVDEEGIKQDLLSLPPDLNATYDRMFHAIYLQPERMKNLAIRAISLVLHSRERLFAAQLQDALAVNAAMKRSDDVKRTDVGIILDVCQGFLDRTDSSQDPIIRPIHFSAREYLQNRPESELSAEVGHSNLAKACLLYLALEDIATVSSRRRDGWKDLEYYAARSFDFHVSKVEHVDDELLSQIRQLLSGPMEKVACILQDRQSHTQFLERNIGGIEVRMIDKHANGSALLYASDLFDVPAITSDAVVSSLDVFPGALHAASSAGKLNAVQFLIEKGHKADEKDSNGWEPIVYAAQQGSLDVVEHLMQKSGKRNEELNGLLHVAIYGRDEEMIRSLFRQGARLVPETRSPDATCVAIAHCRLETVALLLDTGTVSQFEKGSEEHATDISRFLQPAVASGDTERVTLLLNHGATIEKHRSKADLFAIAINEVRGQDKSISMTRLLVYLGADVNTREENGRTPLMMACQYGSLEKVHCLLDLSADVNAKDNEGQGVLHATVATRYGGIKTQIEILETLIGRGVDVNDSPENSSTVLGIASARSEAQILEFLIQKGAEVNRVAGEWSTPLGAAIHSCRPANVKTLLDHDADLAVLASRATWKLVEGLRYGDLRQRNDCDEMVDLLVSRDDRAREHYRFYTILLFGAIRVCAIKSVQRLLGVGVDLELKNDRDRTAIEAVDYAAHYFVKRHGTTHHQDDWTALRNAILRELLTEDLD